MAALRIAIVGAGIAGLTCARALVEAGLSPVILDKSRGVGGRLATRRADGGLQFDHGASHVAATDTSFAKLLEQAAADGALSPWPRPQDNGAEPGPRYVGLPGMSGFARYLASGLDIRTGTTVTSVAADAGGWRVTAADWSETFDRVILTLPAPQILRVLEPHTALTADLSTVRMSPCLTLMAAFPPRAEKDRDLPLPPELDRVTLETAKPGRQGNPQCWVAHGSVDFSQRHLELDQPEMVALLLPLLCAHIGRLPSEAVHAVAHRWRFGLVEHALGRPYLVDPSKRLYLGGDWCLGKTAQDGWFSGRSIAADILGNTVGAATVL